MRSGEFGDRSGLGAERSGRIVTSFRRTEIVRSRSRNCDRRRRASSKGDGKIRCDHAGSSATDRRSNIRLLTRGILRDSEEAPSPDGVMPSLAARGRCRTQASIAKALQDPFLCRAFQS